MDQQQAYTFVTELKAKGANIIEHEWTDMAVKNRSIGTKLRVRGKEAELGPVEIEAAYQR